MLAQLHPVLRAMSKPYTSLSLKLPIYKWAQESLPNPATKEEVKISRSFPKPVPSECAYVPS